MLFDFYEPLLTDKQRMFLKYYFHDDYSLGEIAAESGISRQAVYEHVKRAEQVLESYESKLKLLEKHEAAMKAAAELVIDIGSLSVTESEKQKLYAIIERMTKNEDEKMEVIDHGGI
ncbi:YlxM family DNA-binding protein [Paenibacillus sp. NPDC058071]|uniref:YlxM family DNA-binding protein n=1 Tax=Paenibacillus sp. NPDC058071 TaxID=3346326 RepID=UPI0036D99246